MKEKKCRFGHICTSDCQNTKDCPCIEEHCCAMSESVCDGTCDDCFFNKKGEDPLTRIAKRQEELSNMKSREMLYRFSNLCGLRAITNYQNRDFAEIDKELFSYQNELLSRLNVPTSHGISNLRCLHERYKTYESQVSKGYKPELVNDCEDCGQAITHLNLVK